MDQYLSPLRYFLIITELNVAQKEKNIDEWMILLKNTILLMKSQLVTSNTLKHDVNRGFWNPAWSKCKHVYDFFLLFKVAEISSHGEYSYYGSVFIAFEIFPNHNYC
jgi:hypothetical protein